MNLRGIWTPYTSANSPILPNHWVFPLAASPSDSILWCGTNPYHISAKKSATSQLLRYHESKWEEFAIPDELRAYMQIQNLAVDNAGRLWGYIPPNVVFTFDGKTTTVFVTGKYKLPSFFGIFPTFGMDANHNIWVSIDGTGIARFKDDQAEIFSRENTGQSLEQVSCLCADNSGSTWFAAVENDTIIFVTFDGKRWSERPEYRLPYQGETINAMVFDKQDNLWLSWKDLFEQSSHIGIWYVDSSGKVRNKHTSENSALPSVDTYSLALDKKNRVWVGGVGGITVFDDEQSACWTSIIPHATQSPTATDGIVAPPIETMGLTIGGHVVSSGSGEIWSKISNGVALFTETT